MQRFRPAERLLLAYFAYTLVLPVLVGGLAWRVAATAIAAGGVVWTLGAIWPQSSSNGGSRLRAAWLRDWLPLAFIPIAYWQMDFIRRPDTAATFARRWLPADDWLLHQLHADAWGAGGSLLVESAYALTYVIPPAALAVLYATHRTDRVDRFHRIFFAGTLAAYALLPLFPSASPRLIDPGGWDPPMNAIRQFNVWFLDHVDIHSSVFPSGHVAASFSAAFGLVTALPERRRIGSAAVVLALLIAVATVYGRYHYAVDVVASIAITVIVWRMLTLRRMAAGTLVLAAVLSFAPSMASGGAALTTDEELSIARAFAPVLVFHPEEKYFPLSSRDGLASTGTFEELGERLTKYSAMSRDERLALAAVGYRVFERTDHGTAAVVVEYWCHYVYNAYSLRVGLLPYRVRDNHPEDLERLYIELTQTRADGADVHNEAWARRAFRIRRVVANAHDGGVPPNQYDADAGAPITLPLTILVERGSHAMAPDINRDGWFTPSIDSTGPGKLVWGIRDGGQAWGWYRTAYMDARDDTAVRLCAEVTLSSGPPCEPYSLYAVDDLQRWFDGLQLSNQERISVVGRTSWLTRMFSDVRVENLLVPQDPPDGSVLDHMLRRRTRAEEGFETGFTTTDGTPSVVAGKRFFWNVPSARMPDVVADVSTILPSGKRTQLQATLTASYALDATTNVILGGGWFSDGRRGRDGVFGFDIHVGRFHVQPLHRLHHEGFHANVVALF
jgi:membrane-associated phospholipid phosphatase